MEAEKEFKICPFCQSKVSTELIFCPECDAHLMPY